jgi:hypothetical protein
LEPQDLRSFIDKHGNAKTKLMLLPFKKSTPNQDLA